MSARTEPMPFFVALPGRDTIGLEGIRSVSRRAHGLLHLEGDVVTFEWSVVRHSETVALTRVAVEDESTEPELLEIPAAWVADARLIGGWWQPRLVLRGRRLDAFEGVPGTHAPGTVALRILRAHRAVAAAMAAALRAAGDLAQLPAAPVRALRDG